ncbi:MAG: 4-alpha-glucanotransferase, partial [Eubacterium sp.]|nr:4-alpha-glucanotransferase [Eubacterium sp.]
LGSPARMAIVPIQDVFGQGSDCRMNVPGVADGNWAYLARKDLFTDWTAEYLESITKLFGR